MSLQVLLGFKNNNNNLKYQILLDFGIEKTKKDVLC